MKVGIVSLFGTFNYGNRLQNYAVQEVLRRLGCETEVIHVQQKKYFFREMGKKLYFSRFGKTIFKPNRTATQRYARQKNFEKFNARYINVKRYFSIKKIENADYYVLGSDQVWNPKRYNHMTAQLFFLSFTEPKKKVCFAPSFGVSRIPDKWTAEFRKQLKTFPKISVRESSGAEIVKSLTGKNAEVLIDPTLMLSREDWRKIEKKPVGIDIGTEYILNVFLGDVPTKAVKTSEQLIQKTNYNVFNLLDPGTGKLFTSGPSEYLFLIDHASLIQTDSFHACVFSFIFGIPFLLYAREGSEADMFSRIDTLFNSFDIMRKYVDSGLENDILECDYSNGYRNLKKEQNKVLAFLLDSMNLKKEQ